MSTTQSNPALSRNKNYLLLFFGGFVSRIGNGVHYIALTWFILEVTQSGTATGIIMFLSTIPGVLLGPLGGVVTDRVNRKFLIVGMDILSGLVVLWLSWTIFVGVATFWHISIATVLIASCAAFFNPAIGATIPNLVRDEDLQKANSLEQLSTNFTTIIGAAIGGVLIAVYGIGTVFLINGLSFIFSGLSELFIKIPPTQKEGDEKVTLIEDLKFGARYLYEKKNIFTLFVISLFTNFLCAGILLVGMPFILKEILTVNSKLFGIGQAIFPAGAVIGAIILSILSNVKNYYKVLISSMTVMGLIFFLIGIPITPVVMSQFSTFHIYLIITSVIFIFGATISICNIPMQVLLQRMIPDYVRGRVFGLLGSLNRALVPISMALTGVLLDLTHASSLLIGIGVLWLLVVLVISQLSILKTVGMETPEQQGNLVQSEVQI